MERTGRASHTEGLGYSRGTMTRAVNNMAPGTRRAWDTVDEEKDKGTKIRESKGVEGRT